MPEDHSTDLPPVETLSQSRRLRAVGLRVTRQRLAVLDALARSPHAGADAVAADVRRAIGHVSTQAIYDVLHTLTEHGLVRRIQPAGSVARYEVRVGDNHHHVVCRRCGAVGDIDCAVGAAPCLHPQDIDARAPGFVLVESEVTYWGLCASCAAPPTVGRGFGPPADPTSERPADPTSEQGPEQASEHPTEHPSDPTPTPGGHP